MVGADGTNSVVRDAHRDVFGTQLAEYSNRFAWYGTETRYECNALTFVETEHGAFCGHHYRYKPRMSTFVAECDAAAWQGHRMAEMTEDERRHFSEELFAPVLTAPLISNRSAWNPWRIYSTERWHHGNVALIGDALRTAHPSIGSGTRLAMEDAIFLWRALEAESRDIPAALAAYETERRPIREKLNLAATRSIDWYEKMGEFMSLAALRFRLFVPDAHRAHDRRAAAQRDAAVHAPLRFPAPGGEPCLIPERRRPARPPASAMPAGPWSICPRAPRCWCSRCRRSTTPRPMVSSSRAASPRPSSASCIRASSWRRIT